MEQDVLKSMVLHVPRFEGLGLTVFALLMAATREPYLQKRSEGARNMVSVLLYKGT